MKKILSIFTLLLVLSLIIPVHNAHGLGLIWSGVSKSGSSVIDLEDVAGGYQEGQIMKFQLSNSTFIPYTLPVGGSGTYTAINSNVGTTLMAFNSTTTAVFKNLLDSTYITWTNGTNALTATLGAIPESMVTNLTTDLGLKEDKANKGASNGYADLNSNSIVPSSELGSGTNSSGKFLDGTRVWATIKNPLLDGSNHTDTTAQTVSTGSLIYGNITPTWDELVIGLNGQFLYSNGTQPKWVTFQVNTQSASAGFVLTGVSNSTGVWTTATIKNPLLDGSNHTDTVAQTPTRGSIIYGDSSSLWNELVLGVSGQFLFSDGTDVKYGTIKNKLLDGSNHTDTTAQTVSRGSIIYGDSTPTWNELVIGSNGQFLYSNALDVAWKTFMINNQTVTGSTFISGINNNTGVITTGTAYTNISNNDATNSTLIASNSTTGTASLKTISATNGTAIDNGANTLTIRNTRVISLTANQTTTVTADYGYIFSIPLTASSGNNISGVIIGVTNVTNNAVQYSANVTQANTKGSCLFKTPLTATTTAFDFFVLNNTAPTVDTAETVWTTGVGVPNTIEFYCSVYATATAGNLNILQQNEASATLATAVSGSQYVITP